MFDQFAGDDSVEFLAEVHGLHIAALGVEAHFFEYLDPGRIDVDAEGIFVDLENAIQEHIGFVIDAFLRRVFGRP